MSIGTFFSKVEAELKKLFGSTTWEQKAQSIIRYVSPIVSTIITLADPAIAPLVNGIVSTVQSDLATVSVVVQGAQVAPGTTAAQTAETALNSIQENLSSLLTAAEVKSAATGAKITATATLIIGEIDALLADLPGGTPVPPAMPTPPAPPQAGPAVTVTGS